MMLPLIVVEGMASARCGLCCASSDQYDSILFLLLHYIQIGCAFHFSNVSISSIINPFMTFLSLYIISLKINSSIQLGSITPIKDGAFE